MNGWIAIERLPIVTIGDDPNDNTKVSYRVRLIDYGIPPDGYIPSIGDYYFTPEREFKAWMGEMVSPGSKFPVGSFKDKKPFEHLI